MFGHVWHPMCRTGTCQQTSAAQVNKVKMHLHVYCQGHGPKFASGFELRSVESIDTSKRMHHEVGLAK